MDERCGHCRYEAESQGVYTCQRHGTPRPVLGDEQDFRARVMRDPRLYAIATMLGRELHEGRITIDDAVRLGIMAANEYLIRRNHAGIFLRVEDER